MYPWDVLGLEPTDDRKAIKKAYARLLKKNRPLDDPAAFQELHQAYQVALSWSQVPVPHHQLVVSQTVGSEPMLLEPPAELDERSEIHQQIKQQLQTGILELAEPSQQRQRLQPQSWAFLNQFHDVADFATRDDIAHQLFELVAKLNHRHMVQTGQWLFNGQAMYFLNEVFGWDRDWTVLEAKFPAYYLTYTLHILDQGFDRSAQRPAGPVVRVLALLVDVLLSLIVTWAVSRLNRDLDLETLAWLALAVYWLMTVVGECSVKRTTLGKALFYVFITDVRGHHPSTAKILLRLVLFQLAMIPAYFWWLYGVDVLQITWMYPLLFIAIYSVLVLFINRMPLHDDWSRCRVARLMQV
jgi:hypothetical protein